MIQLSIHMVLTVLEMVSFLNRSACTTFQKIDK